MSNYKAMISDDVGLKVDTSTGKVSTIGRKAGVGLVTRDHVDIDPVTNLITDPVHRAAVGEVTCIALAQSLDVLISGAVTRDANGAAVSAAVAWPDGATGVYTATSVSTAFPGAVDAYTVTRVLNGVTTTYTQPAVTRDSTGAVTNKPAVTVA